ncbi:MAG: hypothetical protein DMF68_16280 [Acidobacteria bacterium]|nr:MAG: hypothetical protein DMF68_16280 [Acidobacteriota bacterium]
MKTKTLAAALTALLLALFSNTVRAASRGDEDTNTRIVNAKVVEVADSHISVMARSGVEHVIAVDGNGTRVTINGKLISIKEIREGDVVTIELDAQKPVKFAKNIRMRSEEFARLRR